MKQVSLEGPRVGRVGLDGRQGVEIISDTNPQAWSFLDIVGNMDLNQSWNRDLILESKNSPGCTKNMYDRDWPT